MARRPTCPVELSYAVIAAGTAAAAALEFSLPDLIARELFVGAAGALGRHYLQIGGATCLALLSAVLALKASTAGGGSSSYAPELGPTRDAGRGLPGAAACHHLQAAQHGARGDLPRPAGTPGARHICRGRSYHPAHDGGDRSPGAHGRDRYLFLLHQCQMQVNGLARPGPGPPGRHQEDTSPPPFPLLLGCRAAPSRTAGGGLHHSSASVHASLPF